LQKIETSKILVNSARIKNLDTLIYEMEENDKNYKYSVGWIDTLSTGKNFGRSILIFGNHATSEDLVNLKKQNILSYKPKKSITLPARVPFNLINRFTVKIFNEIWYLKHFPKNKKNLKDISNFFFPLDSLKNWNKLYGPKGFIQYQIVLPNNHKHLIYEIIEIFSRQRCPIFLAVLTLANTGLWLKFSNASSTLKVSHADSHPTRWIHSPFQQRNHFARGVCQSASVAPSMVCRCSGLGLFFFAAANQNRGSYGAQGRQLQNGALGHKGHVYSFRV
jgi:decaprenylphospho-beta-D-ribofuranose 2-oxidase